MDFSQESKRSAKYWSLSSDSLIETNTGTHDFQHSATTPASVVTSSILVFAGGNLEDLIVQSRRSVAES